MRRGSRTRDAARRRDSRAWAASPVAASGRPRRCSRVPASRGSLHGDRGGRPRTEAGRAGPRRPSRARRRGAPPARGCGRAVRRALPAKHQHEHEAGREEVGEANLGQRCCAEGARPGQHEPGPRGAVSASVRPREPQPGRGEEPDEPREIRVREARIEDAVRPEQGRQLRHGDQESALLREPAGRTERRLTQAGDPRERAREAAESECQRERQAADARGAQTGVVPDAAGGEQEQGARPEPERLEPGQDQRRQRAEVFPPLADAERSEHGRGEAERQCECARARQRGGAIRGQQQLADRHRL